MAVTIRGTLTRATLYTSNNATQPVTFIGTVGPYAGGGSSSVIHNNCDLTIIGPIVATADYPAVVSEGTLHVTGPAYSVGQVPAFVAYRWDIVAGYDLAIATQDTQDPPHPVTLVSNPWAVEVSPGVTAADRLLATATPQSTGAQIAAAVTN